MLPGVSRLIQAKVEMPEDFQLEVKVKPEAKPIFCRPKPIPLAILEDLNDACEDRFRKGVWKTPDFEAYMEPLWFQCERQSVQDKTKPGLGYMYVGNTQ